MKKLMYVLFALGLLVSAPVVMAQVDGDNDDSSYRCEDGSGNEDTDVTNNEEVSGDESCNAEPEVENEELPGDESGNEDPD